MTDPQAASPWLTIKESCPVAKCGPRLLYREIKAGRLRAARIGSRRDIRIHREWIDQWLISTTVPIEVKR